MTVKIHLPKIDIFLQFGIILLTVKVLLSVSAVVYCNDFIDTLLSILSSILFVIVIIRQRYSLKVLVIYAAIIILGLANAYLIGELSLFITIMTCLAIRGQNFNYVVKHIYFCQLCLFIAHCFIAAILIAINGQYLSTVISGKTRYQFGFSHPNTFSVYVFNLILLWTWIHYESITRKKIWGLVGFIALTFIFTRTRTFLISSIVLCVLLVISKSNRNAVAKVLSIIARYVTIICFAIIWTLTINYKSMNPIVLIVNSMLSGRIRLGAYAYDKLGITLLGQSGLNSVQWDQFWQLNSHTYDCTYTYLTIEKGIIWLIVICIGFYMLSKMRNKKIDVFIILWAIYAVTEVHPLNCYLCFPILLISQLLPTSKKN